MEKFAKPWQAMPSRIISLALVQAKQTTDFDHQLAFLLLDVGVETALKTYLINKKQDVEKIVFPEMLKRVGEELSKDKLQIPLDEIDYFHKTRNKLYHQGDGVKPTGENLTKYADLAKTLLKVLLDVDIDKLPEQELTQPPYYLPYQYPTIIEFWEPSLQSIVGRNIDSLQFNSSLMVEHLYPQIATRKFKAQLHHIRTDTGPDDESYPPLVRVDFWRQRIDAFNKITGWNFTYDEDDDYDTGDHELVEYVIDNPEQLHVWLAFQEISGDDWSKDWEQYKRVVDLLKSETEAKKYEEILEWTYEKADKVFKWVKEHIPDIDLHAPITP
jgi:hypothetical protein